MTVSFAMVVFLLDIALCIKIIRKLCLEIWQTFFNFAT